MTAILALFILAHGLIHLLGFAKAFGLADLPQLHAHISPLAGILWLLAAVLFIASAAAIFVWPRGWWAIAVVAIVLSTAVVVPVWGDAKFGALANAVILIAIVLQKRSGGGL